MKKILVVDDDRLITELVSAALGSEGYETQCASSVSEAIQLVDKLELALLITDILMPPGDDGTKLIRYVKEKQPDVHVLAMTGGVENAVADYVNYADMFSDHTLAKPFSKESLLQSVKGLVSLG